MTSASRQLRVLALALAFVALGTANVRAEDLAAQAKAKALDPKSAEGLPPELKEVGITPHMGAQVPTDVSLVDQEGKAVRLSDYVKGDLPTVLVFAYYTCPMLCTLVLNGTMDAIKGLPLQPGKDFRVVTVSFDGRDTASLAKEKRANYVKAYGRLVGERGWDFLTGDAKEVKRLADTVGFAYRWNEESNQFAHAAGLFVLTPEGKLSKVLFGSHFETGDLRLALADASGGKIGSIADHILLFCFHYEPTSGKYVLAATRLMRAGGILTAVVLGLLVAILFRRDRRRALALAQQPATES